MHELGPVIAMSLHEPSLSLEKGEKGHGTSWSGEKTREVEAALARILKVPDYMNSSMTKALVDTVTKVRPHCKVEVRPIEEEKTTYETNDRLRDTGFPALGLDDDTTTRWREEAIKGETCKVAYDGTPISMETCWHPRIGTGSR